MRIVFSKSAKRITVVFICLFVFLAALFNIGGYFLNIRQISVMAANEQVDKYEVRSRLLMQAMDDVGVCYAKTAADVWAKGLKTRSAALQYSVMTKTLKNEYAKQLEKSFPNWVTGVSSPWIDSYKITNVERMGDSKYIYSICFSTKTSTGPAGDYNAVITVEKEGDFWRITKIQADKELYVYTGLKT